MGARLALCATIGGEARLEPNTKPYCESGSASPGESGRCDHEGPATRQDGPTGPQRLSSYAGLSTFSWADSGLQGS
jgi:hypothetical protein